MSTLNSRLHLSILNRKKGRNLLEKGFTLVELMIVIVIVGVLSSVALPNFLGTQDKAKAGANVGSMLGLAKQCSANAILEDPGVIPTGDQVTLTESTGSTNCSKGATLKNASPFEAGRVEGMTCGAAKANGTDNTCTITVTADGGISGAWSAG